jgi:hypothetical protein
LSIGRIQQLYEGTSFPLETIARVHAKCSVFDLEQKADDGNGFGHAMLKDGWVWATQPVDELPF